MNVEINGQKVEVAEGCNDLGALLAAENMDRPGCAVAVGNAVVPRSRWGATVLEPDMKITVINAVCGG